MGWNKVQVKGQLMRVAVFSTVVCWSNENKSSMRVDESCQVRVCMRVFSPFVSRSNQNKSCMRVDESWSFLNSRVLV